MLRSWQVTSWMNLFIKDLKEQGAKVDIWGVGTHLVTGKDQPALDGVYKLSAVRDPKGPWHHKIKLSEQLVKVSTPGILQIRRFYDDEGYSADMIYDSDGRVNEERIIIDPYDPIHVKQIESSVEYKDLLIPVLRSGKIVYDSPPLDLIRQNSIQELNHFPSTLRRFLNPQPYFVGLEKNLHEKKLAMIQEAKRKNS